MGCRCQLIQPAQVCSSNGIQALLGELPGADLAMAAAFKASLQRQHEHRLHALRVVLVATEVAEPQTIGLERDAGWIKGMHGCSLALMLHPNGSHPFNPDLQGRTVGKRGGVIAVAVMEG